MEWHTSWKSKFTDSEVPSQKQMASWDGQSFRGHRSRSSAPTWKLYYFCLFATCFLNFCYCMGRQCSLPLATTPESTANGIPAQQKSLVQAQVLLDNRIALDYLSAEQGDIHVVANGCTWINCLRNCLLRRSYMRSLNKLVGLTKWLLQWGLYFTYLILTGLGLGRP